MVQAESTAISEAPLACRLSAVDVLGIGQGIGWVRPKIRNPSSKIQAQPEQIAGIDIVLPHELRILAVFLLELIDRL
jgi:hypothetical protein